jgi:hypothetical protein
MFKSIKINKERKYILIGGAVLLFFGLIYRFYPSIHGLVSISDEIAIKKNHIEKYINVVNQRDRIDKERLNLNRILNRVESGLFTGETPSLAAVELQNILNDIAHANNIKINTMQVLKETESGEHNYINIPVRFSFNSNLLQLKEILYEIEASPKLLIITEMNVDLPRRKQEGEIRSTITVQGVMKHKESRG